MVEAKLFQVFIVFKVLKINGCFKMSAFANGQVKGTVQNGQGEVLCGACFQIAAKEHSFALCFYQVGIGTIGVHGFIGGKSDDPVVIHQAFANRFKGKISQCASVAPDPIGKNLLYFLHVCRKV